jgi:hypothetical protein
MHSELLNESLFFRIDHAHSAIAEWVYDNNNFRQYSSLRCQTPGDMPGSSPQPAQRFAMLKLCVFVGCLHRASWHLKN